MPIKKNIKNILGIYFVNIKSVGLSVMLQNAQIQKYRNVHFSAVNKNYDSFL